MSEVSEGAILSIACLELFLSLDVLPRSRLHHTALSWEDQGKRGLDSDWSIVGARCCRLDHSGCERCRCVVLRSFPRVALPKGLQLSV